MTRGGKRPGSGRKAPEGLKKNRSVKFTDTEWELIKQKAKAENITASDYIRKAMIRLYGELKEEK